MKGLVPFPVLFVAFLFKSCAACLLVLWALQAWQKAQKPLDILPEEEFTIPREKIARFLTWDYLYTLDDLAHFPEASVRHFLARAHPLLLRAWLETIPPEQKELFQALVPPSRQAPERGKALLPLGAGGEQAMEPLDELLHRLIYFGELPLGFLLKERRRGRVESMVFKLREHLRAEGDESRRAAIFMANLPEEILGEMRALLAPRELEHFERLKADAGEIGEPLWGSIVQEYLGLAPDERLLNGRLGTSPTAYLTWAAERAAREKSYDDALYLYQKALEKEPENRAVRVRLEQVELQILERLSTDGRTRGDKLKLLEEHYRIRPVVLELSSALSSLSISLKLGSLSQRLFRLRKALLDELGFTFADVHVQDLFTLAGGSYRLNFRGRRVLEGELVNGACLAVGAEDSLRMLREEHALRTTSGIPGVWLAPDKRSKAERLGFPVMDPEEFLFFELSRMLRARIAEFFTLEDGWRILEEFRRTHRALVDRVCPARIPPGLLKAVLEVLLQERLPVKDPEAILYTLDEFADTVRDPEALAEKVRFNLANTAFPRLGDQSGYLYYSSLDSYTEEIIARCLARNDLQGVHLNLDRDMEKELLVKVKHDREKLIQMGKEPVFLAPPETRRAMKKLLYLYYPDIVVLSHEEARGRLKLYPLRRD